MSETEQKWEGLADQVRAGDGSAEAELVSIFQGRVHCMILARTRSLAAARALGPEVLLRAVRALRASGVPPGLTLPAFLHGIVSDLLAGQPSQERDGREPAPEVREKERLELIRGAMAALPAPDRTILLLALVDGLGTAAIASRLGLTAEVVRRRKAHALERVRDQVLTRLPSGRPCP